MKNYSAKLLMIAFLLIYGDVYGNGTDSQENKTVINLDWEVLLEVDWILTSYSMDAVLSDNIKELHGKTVIVEGFMFPLEFKRKHKRFLLSRWPMIECQFCGPGEAESMIFIETDQELAYDTKMFRIQGTFMLSDDVEMGILYELKNARQVK